MKATFESKIQVKDYCENCKAVYMRPRDEGCPVCKAKQEKEERAAAQSKTKKGGNKNE